MRIRHPALIRAIAYILEVAKQKNRVLFMAMNMRYQRKELAPYLGYDMWACWLILVEWFWMLTLAEMGIMPAKDAILLTEERLFGLLKRITTTMQDAEERGTPGKKGTNHDIQALLILIRKFLPKQLHKWLHYGATSYDIICTAYALSLMFVFERPFWTKLMTVDELWREKIDEHAETLQMGRTHLQDALPVTVGFWLAHLHSRFIDCCNEARCRYCMVPGKFTGATGTRALQRVRFGTDKGEKIIMDMLGLPVAKVSTQIAPPEPNNRFYNELLLMSGTLANLGDDTRILQASFCGEVSTESSESSAMSHKDSNPIVAENMCGMHVDVIAENMKLILTLVSNFQRDLRWSSVMRDFHAVMGYNFNQIHSTERLLKSLRVNETRLRENFNRNSKFVVAELLHLLLQEQGITDAHAMVNKKIVPAARAANLDLATQMTVHVIREENAKLSGVWKNIDEKYKDIFFKPELYVGDSVQISREEARNALEPMLIGA